MKLLSIVSFISLLAVGAWQLIKSYEFTNLLFESLFFSMGSFVFILLLSLAIYLILDLDRSNDLDDRSRTYRERGF